MAKLKRWPDGSSGIEINIGQHGMIWLLQLPAEEIPVMEVISVIGLLCQQYGITYNASVNAVALELSVDLSVSDIKVKT